MSNVIRGDFGKPDARREGKVLTPYQRELLTIDFTYYLRTESRIKEALQEGDVILDHIMKVTGLKAPADTEQNDYLAVMRATSLEMLCSYILNSSAKDWRTESRFYGTAALELNARFRIVRLIKEYAEISESLLHKPPE